ncbi:MAG: putative amidase AmiB2 [Actinomycetes bacterium]|nr:MAG: putative amidase AmiB2 [Actinomycetes bacterium]
MDAAELAFAGIHRQAEALRGGAVSSTDLTEMYLERIGRFDGVLNAFRVVLAERARAEAAAADRRIAAGETAPLLGVPIAVKDNVDVAGEVTTLGTAAYDRPATADCAHYRRLREAGAVLLGKTNLPELAIWPFTESPTWGRTRNPWNSGRSAGGSSGGSAVAVAAGLVGAASASDGGGSIRIPAAHCGLFGLKPQRGRISLMPEAEHWLGLSVAGCVSRRVIDTALWLDAAAGSEPGDADTPPAPERSWVEAATRSPGSLRIALTVSVPRPVAPPIVSGEVKAGVERIATLLRSLGHEVVERDPEWGGVGNDITPRYLGGIAAEGRQVPNPGRLEARTRGMIRLGRLLPGRALRRSLGAEAGHAERLSRVLGDADLLLMPTVGTVPPEVDRWAGKGALRTLMSISRAYPCTIPWNYTGQPAASVPLPPERPGELPLAGQLVAPSNREDLLLSVSTQLEAEIGWPERVPGGYE